MVRQCLCDLPQQGRSATAATAATAASAYRAAKRVRDLRLRKVHDYSRKDGVLHNEIVAPERAPDWARNHEPRLNAVDQVKQLNEAHISRKINVALHSELTHEKNNDLTRGFIQA